MSENRFTVESTMVRECILDNKTGEQLDTFDYTERLCDLLNELAEENEQLKNELRKEESLREYADSMYDKDLIVNIRFSMGEWKADVSVIDDE